VKNFRGRIVEQSISHEITENYRTESVSFHLNIGLTNVHASTAHAVGAAEWRHV